MATCEEIAAASAPGGSVACYVHIPFCASRCDYCDFYTRVGVSAERQRDYVASLGAAAARLVSALGDPQIDTLYIGGGTPTTVRGPARDALLRLLEALGTESRETTVEINPEDASADLLGELHAAGVSRLSVGVQSLDEATLRSIGRHVSLRHTREGLELISEMWRGRWSADIITGTPGGSRSTHISDVEQVVAAGADHISVYELTVEYPTLLGLRVRRGQVVPKSSPAVADEFREVSERLISAGFSRYEVSNFARPESESRHNLAYWRMRPHIGVGAGAVGTLPARGGAGSARHSGVRSLQRWVSEPERWELEELGTLESIRERVMMNLRTPPGFDRDEFLSLYGLAPSDLLPQTVARWCKQGALTLNESGVGVTPAGLDLADRIAVDAFDELETTVERILTPQNRR